MLSVVNLIYVGGGVYGKVKQNWEMAIPPLTFLDKLTRLLQFVVINKEKMKRLQIWNFDNVIRVCEGFLQENPTTNALELWTSKRTFWFKFKQVTQKKVRRNVSWKKRGIKIVHQGGIAFPISDHVLGQLVKVLPPFVLLKDAKKK